MSGRTLEVELDGYGSLVRGYGARDLVEEVVGRPPVWSSIRRGWSVQEDTARKVISLADERGFGLVIEDGLSRRQGALDALVAAPPPRDVYAPPEPQDEPEAQLW